MFQSENYKFRAKTFKADETVSGYDTVRRHEKFACLPDRQAAGICNLQLKDSFSELPMAKNSKTQGSTLLIALIIMGILLTLSMGVSELLINSLRDTRVLLEKTKAWYAAEAGIEHALLTIAEEPPGFEIKKESELLEAPDLIYNYRIQAASDKIPIAEPSEQKKYSVLRLNESVTIPLFQGIEPENSVKKFRVEYYITPALQQIRGIRIQENFDILRWKIFGIRLQQPHMGTMEVINEFSPLQDRANTPQQPSCIGTPSTCWNAAKFYERQLAHDGGTEFHIAECNHSSKACFPIETFLQQHKQNFLVLTNMINVEMISGSLSTDEKKKIANIFYRVTAEDKRKMTLPSIKIESDGKAGNTIQSLDMEVKRDTFLPVFNYALYRTAD